MALATAMALRCAPIREMPDRRRLARSANSNGIAAAGPISVSIQSGTCFISCLSRPRTNVGASHPRSGNWSTTHSPRPIDPAAFRLEESLLVRRRALDERHFRALLQKLSQFVDVPVGQTNAAVRLRLADLRRIGSPVNAIPFG